jgi:hypothetical protein
MLSQSSFRSIVCRLQDLDREPSENRVSDGSSKVGVSEEGISSNFSTDLT